MLNIFYIFNFNIYKGQSPFLGINFKPQIIPIIKPSYLKSESKLIHEENRITPTKRLYFILSLLFLDFSLFFLLITFALLIRLIIFNNSDYIC